MYVFGICLEGLGGNHKKLQYRLCIGRGANEETPEYSTT